MSAILVALLLFQALARCATDEPMPAPPSGIKLPYIVPDLPKDHYPYWLRNNPFVKAEFKKICNINDIIGTQDVDHFINKHINLTFEDESYKTNLKHGQAILRTICSKLASVYKMCWGYEHGCEDIYLMPECSVSKPPDEGEVHEQLKDWFNAADFGYIRQRRDELQKFCNPNDASASSLECAKYFRICRGRNLHLIAPKLNESELEISNFYREDLIGPGQVGGHDCDLQARRIPEEGGQKAELQSWFAEMQHYGTNFTGSKDQCDIMIEKPVYIVKLDSAANLYHHLCDFLNLYASQHFGNSFRYDNQIIIWNQHYIKNNFDILWKAFSKNPIKSIASPEYAGKRLCFQTYMMPFLPRMVGGLFYNTHLPFGCRKSGLFKAFNHHVFHRLKIDHDDTNVRKGVIRVTLLNRSAPFKRNIVNVNDLQQAVRSRFNEEQVRMTVVDFNHQFDFKKQLTVIRNTDVLVGVHGAGLAHTLFLPDWATTFELYNCGDTQCYQDLARLRGVNYVTWKNHTKLLPQNCEGSPKHCDYYFDPDEFILILENAIQKSFNERRIYFLNSNSNIIAPTARPPLVSEARPREEKSKTIQIEKSLELVETIDSNSKADTHKVETTKSNIKDIGPETPQTKSKMNVQPTKEQLAVEQPVDKPIEHVMNISKESSEVPTINDTTKVTEKTEDEKQHVLINSITDNVISELITQPAPPTTDATTNVPSPETVNNNSKDTLSLLVPTPKPLPPVMDQASSHQKQSDPVARSPETRSASQSPPDQKFFRSKRRFRNIAHYEL